jgi:hypothetical protein
MLVEGRLKAEEADGVLRFRTRFLDANRSPLRLKTR